MTGPRTSRSAISSASVRIKTPVLIDDDSKIMAFILNLRVLSFHTMSTKPPTIKTLSNGVRLAVVPDPTAIAATVMVLINVGSAFESEQENGLSHFLEHMCFKGTDKRPTPRALTEEIESLGAITNAFTDREFTGYFIKGNPSHVAEFADILADIYHHSTFPGGEVEKEKGVIVEEINMYEDMPAQKVSDVLFAMLYGNHATGRSVLGTKETVRSFGRDDFVRYKGRFYTAANTTLVFSGDVTVKTAMALAKKHFGTLAKGAASRRKKVVERQRAPLARLYPKKSDQAHLMLAFRSLPLGHKDILIARLIATILGKGMSSRLTLLVRDELGAAYYIYAMQESYTDHGLFAIAAGIDRTRIDEIVSHLVAQCNRLKDELVGDKELAKAKEYMIGTFRLSLELTDSIAEFYGGQVVLRQTIKTPEQVIALIKKVSARDIMRVARILFRQNKANLAVVGDFKDGQLPHRALSAL